MFFFEDVEHQNRLENVFSCTNFPGILDFAQCLHHAEEEIANCTQQKISQRTNFSIRFKSIKMKPNSSHGMSVIF